MSTDEGSSPNCSVFKALGYILLLSFFYVFMSKNPIARSWLVSKSLGICPKPSVPNDILK